MDRAVTILTGAAGFLGSAAVVGLCRDRRIVAINRREPTEDLARRTAGAVVWRRTDIADTAALQAVFRETLRACGRINFVVHFAAYYDFGTSWRPEYERTNIGGTAALLQCARDAKVRRLVFASSLAAMLPPPPGGALTETSPTADYIPYARSKSAGEELIREASGDVPAAILRIGGVFSDWCELPPLSSLLRTWTGRSPMNRILAGAGDSGMPYIHRADLVTLVRACLDRHEQLGPAEVLLGCPDGATSHKDLWAPVARAWNPVRREPLFLPAPAARIGVALRYALGCLARRPPYERPWMLRFVDRPWTADAAYTRRKLDWDCTPGMGILERMPVILDNLRKKRERWIVRNDIGSRTHYAYEESET